MNNRTVAHEWANQTRESRRGSNFFFEGPALYSYGRYFIVGLIVPGDTKKRKGKIALLNSARYSNSTSTHQNAARAAVFNLCPVFTVPAMSAAPEDVKANCAYYLAEIVKLQEKLIRSRTNGEYYERELTKMIREAAAFTNYFNRAPLKMRRAIAEWCNRLEAGNLITPEERATLKVREEAVRRVKKAEEAARAARAAEERAKAEAQLKDWVDGVPGVQAPASYSWTWGYTLPTRLRIKGAAVETSRGAVVSCKAALTVWHMIKAGRDIVGVVLDGYEIKAFNGELKIGCHNIDRAEVERIGALLEARKEEKQGE